MSACFVIFLSLATDFSQSFFFTLVALPSRFTSHTSVRISRVIIRKKRMRSWQVIPAFYNDDKKMDYIALKFRSRVYIHFGSRVSLGLNVVSIDSFPILSLAILHGAIVFWFVNCLPSTCNQSTILKKHNLWSAIISLKKEKLFNIDKNYKIIL